VTVSLFAPGAPAWADESPPPEAGPAEAQAIYRVYLPVVAKPPCATTGQSYGSLSIVGNPTDRPAEFHGDINLGLRGYQLVTGQYLGLVDIGGPTDAGAPQLPGLFADNRTATFVNAYQTNQWIWGTPPDPGFRGDPVTVPPVTVIGMATTPGELIRVPPSGYTIGDGYEVLVLYATANRITVKYTREDNVVAGYTLHVDNVCVDRNLIALYNQRNSEGRRNLPALREGQAFGRANSSELIVAIRDWGTFMDPRSRKDWWKGR
jgi:hypothetical protein